MFTALQDFDFQLLNDQEFKEDSVREEIVNPILKELGYSAGGLNRIVRSRSLKHPFVKTGSGEREIRIVPDYLMLAANKPAWVLDAKSPNQSITGGSHVEQTYFYAIHPDIRSHYFALCNGREFVVFEKDRQELALQFQVSEIGHYWNALYKMLAPNGFKPGSAMSAPEAGPSYGRQGDFYSLARPLPQITDLKRQSARRHYGVHPYFTRQVWNVVQEYIKNFSRPNDLVLDPFGGTGVTAIESIVLNRRTIHIDINPLSIFMVRTLAQPIDMDELDAGYNQVVSQFKCLVPKSDSEIRSALGKYPYPRGIRLPKGSDVDTIEQLFSDRQLAELALLKHLILCSSNGHIRDHLLLMFSGLLNKSNLTFHKTQSPGGGDSAMMRMYRYRIAPSPGNSDVLHFFGVRYRRITSAKKELAPYFAGQSICNFHAYQGTATNLSQIPDECVDYVYTDPPYGAKIQYLDLSTMWLAWLDLPVSDSDREQEIIEGGRLEKTKDDYGDLMGQSIRELYRVLKFDRWMSFVFNDKNPYYWHTIVETAEKAGFEYMGAIPQSNNKTSFKKRQNPSTVLSGQLIINFRKVRSPRAIMKLDLGDDATDLILETAEGVIAENDGANIEEVNSELIIKGIELGFLDLLSKKYDDLSPLLEAYFDLDEETQKYHLPQNKKFKSAIPVDLRLRYFLLSYLKRQHQKGIDPEFSDIVQSIMPLLKNGITPENQTILNVLRVWARETPSGRWRLRDDGQMRMDGF